MDGRRRAIGYALMAAVFYALNAPLPKLMPGDVPPGRNVPDKRIINYSPARPADAGNARRFACGRA
ncbi:MAG: hypothetical protein ACI4P5_10990 [Candidatus Fimadaptatus sp.]